MPCTFVGCQPIYKSNLDVAAYEILYRSGTDNAASFADGDQATAELILNTFTDIGLDQVVGEHPAFINVTRKFILDHHAYTLPKERVVLEVLEDIQPEPEILEALQGLSESGYTIALDDFVYAPHMQPLVDLANIIKVELPAIDAAELPRHVELLRHSNAQLLAEKIETHEEFERCRELGFDLYQGYFLSKPNVVTGKRIPVNRIAALQLVNQLCNPTTRTSDLVNTVGSDPSLCYKLLKYVNSASSGLTRHIDSISAAITLIGFRRLRSFTSLALLASASNNKPIQLVATALTRARMCEQLAIERRHERPDMYFITGLFSMLDALLDQPMNEALQAVPLADSISDAILSNEGTLAEVLNCVLSYERGEWEGVILSDVASDVIRSAYADALTWANRSVATLSQMA